MAVLRDENTWHPIRDRVLPGCDDRVAGALADGSFQASASEGSAEDGSCKPSSEVVPQVQNPSQYHMSHKLSRRCEGHRYLVLNPRTLPLRLQEQGAELARGDRKGERVRPDLAAERGRDGREGAVSDLGFHLDVLKARRLLQTHL